MRQGVRLEPLLEAISKFLDRQHEMIEWVRRDLVRGLKKPRQGRRGLTAPQVLRSLVLMRVKNWDYRELRERIADGLTLRQFTDFYCDPVPKHDAFNRGFNRLTPQTLKAVNDLVVQAAVALGLEDGAKLRVDTTVVETDIHHPTDNTLLWDVVRVVTRLVGRLAKALEMRCIKGFHDRRRSAHRRMYEIQRMTTRQRQERQTTIYRALIGIAEEVVASAKTALEKTATMRGKDLFAAMAIDAIRDEIAHYCGLGEQVIDQARRRTDLVRCVRHDLLAGQNSGLDELANLMMADTKLCSRVTECQPLAVLVGGEAAVNAMHAAQRPDTVRCPGLALAGRHSHSVQRCCNMLIRPSAGHAAHDGERLLGCVTAMLAGSQLADAQLGMLAAFPVDDKHDLSRRLVDVGNDLGDQRPHQSLARSHCCPWHLPCRREVISQSRE